MQAWTDGQKKGQQDSRWLLVAYLKGNYRQVPDVQTDRALVKPENRKLATSH